MKEVVCEFVAVRLGGSGVRTAETDGVTDLFPLLATSFTSPFPLVSNIIYIPSLGVKGQSCAP